LLITEENFSKLRIKQNHPIKSKPGRINTPMWRWYWILCHARGHSHPNISNNWNMICCIFLIKSKKNLCWAQKYF